MSNLLVGKSEERRNKLKLNEKQFILIYKFFEKKNKKTTTELQRTNLHHESHKVKRTKRNFQLENKIK